MEQRNNLVYLGTADILPHPKNPRKELGDLTEMAESIKANGIMQNLTVVEVGNLPAERIAELGITAEDIDKGRYMVVIGHRRLAAAKLVGLGEVPCVISEMSYADQLATFVTENKQRNDLTPVEEAQGLRQLSMELGLNAAQISEKTGISETTVRRRLKVAAIPAAELEQAAKKAKQLSIGDLERVGEINDEKLRAEALAAIGTPNFDWKVKQAKDTEKKRDQIAAWREVMETMGIREITHSEKYSMEWSCMVKVSLLSKPCGDKFFEAKADGTIKPEWEIGYCFDTYPDEVKLYAKTREKPAESPDKQARRKEYEARSKVKDRLKEAFDELSEKRLCFVVGLTSAEAEAVFGRFMAEAVRFWANYGGTRDINEDELVDLLGDWRNDGDEIDEDALADVMRDSERHPVQTALRVLYQTVENELAHEYPFVSWQYDDGKSRLTLGNYRRDDSWQVLSDAYRLLEAIGYEVDREEKALLDGTSRMYYENGGEEVEIGGDAEETAEEPAEEPSGESQSDKTRFEVYQAMSEKELTYEIGEIDNYYGELEEAIHSQETPEDVARVVSYFLCPYEAADDEDAEEIRRAKCALHGDNCERCITAWLNEPYIKDHV